MKKFIRRYLPQSIQSFLRKSYYRFPILRKIYYFPTDLSALLKGKRNKMAPPRSKIFVGDGDFDAIGKEFRNYFIDLCHLESNEKVLEVGSGIGRMALPLTTTLTDGEYEGIDIVKDGIRWCQKHITPQFPNFRFQLADINNKLYNPKGRFSASEYKFPFPDAYFDFVFLTSVFTHMLPPEVENYISEISRVLKKDGRGLFTFFLLNPGAMDYVKKESSRFSDEIDGCRVIDKNIPEAAIAFQESLIRKFLEEHGLQISEPIHYGSWCRRKEFLSSQDIVIVVKR